MDNGVGYRLEKKCGVPGGHFIFYDGIKEPFITPSIEWRSIPLQHDDIVVDIGAYVGAYSLTCARFPVKKVTAYEPTPRSYKLMQLTQLPNLENVHAAVVGHYNKTVDLFFARGVGLSNSIVKKSYKTDKITVPAVNYVEAVKEASVVKIDIEGAEYELFYEAISVVQPSLRAIIMDFHQIGKDWLHKAEKIIKDMTDAGFINVKAPRWRHGLTSAGSWIRPKEWTSPLKSPGHHKELMSGKLCCGCGTFIDASQKALCKDCYSLWAPKHKEGFVCTT